LQNKEEVRNAEIQIWIKVSDFLEEQQEKHKLNLRGIFKEMDRDGDNTLTPREFVATMKRKGLVLNKDEVLV
jgi:hypothetical protein